MPSRSTRSPAASSSSTSITTSRRSARSRPQTAGRLRFSPLVGRVGEALRFSTPFFAASPVPSDWTSASRHRCLPLIAKITTEEELRGLAEYAPYLTAEVLFALHDGLTPEEVLEQVTAPVRPDEPVDVTDYEKAMTRPATLVTTDDAALQAVLAGDFARWQVFLHPLQRKIVERTYNGPARVSGGPGTGKTIVALHRVKHLVDRLPPGNGKDVLFTTFNKNLAADLRNRLLELAGRDILERVEVVNIDSLASKVLSEAEPGTRRHWLDDIKSCRAVGGHAARAGRGNGGTPASCTMSGRMSCSGRPSGPGRSTSVPAAQAGAGPSTACSARRSGSWSSSSPSGSPRRTSDVPPGRCARRADRAGAGFIAGSPLPSRGRGRGPRLEPRALDAVACHGRAGTERYVPGRRYPPADLRQLRLARQSRDSDPRSLHQADTQLPAAPTRSSRSRRRCSAASSGMTSTAAPTLWTGSGRCSAARDRRCAATRPGCRAEGMLGQVREWHPETGHGRRSGRGARAAPVTEVESYLNEHGVLAASIGADGTAPARRGSRWHAAPVQGA